MVDTERQSGLLEASPLDRDEIMALAGGGTVVVGTLLPAMQPGFGEPQSLLSFASTTTFIFWGYAGSVFWSVARRRACKAAVPGTLLLLTLLVFAVFVWLEYVREPVQTFFGSVQAEFRPMAWAVIAIGSALIQFAGVRSGRNHIPEHSSAHSNPRIRAVGVTLAILGCLAGLSLVNPFRVGAPSEIRGLAHNYEEGLRVMRWLWLGLATLCIVFCVQYPGRAVRILQTAIRVVGVVIGAAIFFVLSFVVPETRLLTILVGGVWMMFGVTFWVGWQGSGTFALWKKLVVAAPFVVVFGLLLMSGEVEDLFFFLYPPFAVAAGYVICRDTKFVDGAIFASTLIVGLPAGLMMFSGVDGMISDVLGVNAAEARLGMAGVCCLLGWAVVLSFQNERFAPSDVAAAECEFEGAVQGTVQKE